MQDAATEVAPMKNPRGVNSGCAAPPPSFVCKISSYYYGTLASAQLR